MMSVRWTVNFLSMEYVDGEDLASLLRRIGRLPEDKALEIARKLCAGLAAAHNKGVLHRDLKPGNIMLDARGQVLLTDFGLAGLASEIAGNEVRSGTPAYMAPEQLAGKEVTARSDIMRSAWSCTSCLPANVRLATRSRWTSCSRPNSTTRQPPSRRWYATSIPGVEGIVRRCLDPDPAKRPGSPLLVAAALPGGDPLQAALAAGETPSPELVAAAGEDTGLRLRVAVPLLAFVLTSIFVHAWLSARGSWLEFLRPSLSPEVLRYQARQFIRELGYKGAIDSADGLSWIQEYMRWVSEHEKPVQWRAVATGRAPVLRFWYREAMEPLTGVMFHDDYLTLGVTTPDDPPPTTSGSIYVALDSRGRLLEFHAMPVQKTDAPVVRQEPDWNPLFRAAALDPATLTPTDPLWTWLETSDQRAAWTGVWPGSKLPLRVEAAAFGGKPVAFALSGPWTETPRISVAGRDDPRLFLIAAILVTVLGASVFLARRNLVAGRGDRRGAFRIGAVMFVVQMSLWATRMHYRFGFGLLGYFLVAVLTAIGNAVVVWMLYLALEPFVRRYWPQTLIASTRMLSGQIRDALVGRDILVGAAACCVWRIVVSVHRLMTPGEWPNGSSEDLVLSSVGALREMLENVPNAVRFTLVYFGAIFLLRLLFRRDWAAGIAFTALWVGVAAAAKSSWFDLLVTVLVYGTVSFVTIQFGLLALASLILMDGLIGDMPATLDSSAWFYPTFLAIVLACSAIVMWAFRQSIRGRPLPQALR